MKFLIKLQWILVIVALTLFIFGWGYVFAMLVDYYDEVLIIRAKVVNIN